MAITLNTQPANPSPPPPLAPAFICGAIVSALLLLFYRGELTQTSDELLMALTARSLALQGSLRFPETYGQTFTGYGLGLPLVAAPLVWLERLLSPLLGQSGRSLLPLVNVAAIGGITALASHVAAALGSSATASRRRWAVVLLVLAGPLFPTGLTLYSEPLTGLGLLLTACVLTAQGRRPRLGLAGAFIGALLAVSCRSSAAPFVLLILVWGWRGGAPRPRLASAAVGIAAAVALRAVQNAVLRGSPFDQGYAGQEFTTPLWTGLHGLLFAVERGLLVFWPVVLLLLSPSPSPVGPRRWQALALASLVAALLFHGAFWTWHGGWTLGPRFLIPMLPLALPFLAVRLAGLGEESPIVRIATVLALVWSLWGAFLYSLFSPMAWWNEIWGFHQIESRWLFEAPLSLWANWRALWADGAFQPALAGLLGIPGALALGLVLVACAALCARQTGFTDGAQDSLRQHSTPMAILLVGVIVMALAGALRGPRGAALETGDRITWLRVDEPPGVEPVRGAALLDLRPHGTYRFWAKADCNFRLTLDGQPVLEDGGSGPTRLVAGSFDVSESGPVLLEFEAGPDEPGGGVFLRVYWSWPGEGRLLQPLGGEYVQPGDLSPLQSAATWMWRRIGPLGGLWLALVLLITFSGCGRKRP